MKTYNYASKYEVVCHSGFDLHFTSDYGVELRGHVLRGHLYIFGEMSIQILCPSTKMQMSLSIIELGYLYVLYTRSLSDILFRNIMYMCIYTYISCVLLFILLYFWLHWVFVVERDFSSCSEQGLLFAVGSRLSVWGLLLQSVGSECGLVVVVVLLALWQWNLPGPGIELCSLH